MNILIGISKVFDALAWPVAAVIVVYILKNPISKLLLRLEHAKLPGTAFDFGKAITDARSGRSVSSHGLPVDARQLKLAELSPRGAILESWLELEETLAGAAETEGISRFRAGGLKGKIFPVELPVLGKSLVRIGKLSITSYERFLKLRQIRNKAVHVTDEVISTDDAEAFIRLVAELKFEIKSAR